MNQSITGESARSGQESIQLLRVGFDPVKCDDHRSRSHRTPLVAQRVGGWPKPNVAPAGIILPKSWHRNFHATVKISSPHTRNCDVNFGLYDSIEIDAQKKSGDT